MGLSEVFDISLNWWQWLVLILMPLTPLLLYIVFGVFWMRSAKKPQFAENVRRTPDEIMPNGYNMPSIAGLDWNSDGKSLVVAYADGELIRHRL